MWGYFTTIFVSLVSAGENFEAFATDTDLVSYPTFVHGKKLMP